MKRKILVLIIALSLVITSGCSTTGNDKGSERSASASENASGQEDSGKSEAGENSTNPSASGNEADQGAYFQMALGSCRRG